MQLLIRKWLHLNSNIKLIILVFLLICCQNNRKEIKEKYHYTALKNSANLEACDSVTNKVFDDHSAKVIFCFNGNCSICFYKCKQFYSLFHQTFERKKIRIFYVFISEFKEEAIVNFNKIKIGQPAFYDVNNEFTKSNNLNVSVEPQVLFIDNKRNVFLFKDLLNTAFEKKQLLKIIDGIEL